MLRLPSLDGLRYLNLDECFSSPFILRSPQARLLLISSIAEFTPHCDGERSIVPGHCYELIMYFIKFHHPCGKLVITTLKPYAS
jgi:hypothetical protein